MGQYEDLLDRISEMPNSTCFLAKFSGTNAALEALKALSFAERDSYGLSLPQEILCSVFPMEAGGAMLVIGGSVSDFQRTEIFHALKAGGQIQSVALPPGVVADPEMGNHVDT